MLEKLFLAILEGTLGVSVVIALMLLLTPLLEKHFSAKWRYWVWLVLAVRLLVPVNLTLPKAPIAVQLPARQVVVTRDADAVAPRVTVQEHEAPQDSAMLPLVPQNSGQTALPAPQNEGVRFSVSLTLVLAAVWAAGAAGTFGWQLFAYLRFRRRLRIWNKPLAKTPAQVVLEQLCAELEIHSSIPLCRNKLVQSPMMVGFVQPVLLLPAAEFSDEDLLMILRHELTHFRRRDLWYKLLLLLARCLHWFNPLVYLMLREADNDLEISCDEAVVRGAKEEFRRRYCDTILRIMRGGKTNAVALSTGFYSGKKVLKRRFTAILNSRTKRGILLLALMLVLLALSGMVLTCGVQQPPAPQAPPTAAAAPPATATPAEPAPDETIGDAESSAAEDSGVLLDPNTNTSLPVSNLSDLTLGKTIFSMQAVSVDAQGTALPGSDSLLWLSKDTGAHSNSYVAYYDVETQRAMPLKGLSGMLPQYFPLSEQIFVFQEDDGFCFYDMTAEDVATPVATLGGNGRGLAEGDIWSMYQIATDRANPAQHAGMYYKKEELVWRVCSFSTRGELLSDFSTGLPVVEDYIASLNYAGGLLYFTYYPDSTAISATRAHYCVDARADHDHVLQQTD